MQTVAETIINVPEIEPRLKHPTIFQVFDGLSGGESLVIHNDHDPKPVYYQLLGERGDIFTWEYLEQGPELWKVRITKKGADDKETVGQIAAKDLRKAEVFKKYGIDFCCGGKKTVREVCAEKGMDATKIEQELQQANEQKPTGSTHAYNDWNLDFLADFITNTHHQYARKNLPEIRAYALKVAQVHGGHHPELLPIQQLVTQVDKELTAHMEQEERILFPYVKAIVQSKNLNQQAAKKDDKDLQSLINELEQEHDTVGRYLETIRVKSQDFAIPEDACASYKLLYKMLADFEEDLHLHIHLENNILFPKAVALEQQ